MAPVFVLVLRTRESWGRMTRSVGKGRYEVPDRQGEGESPWHLGPAREVLYQDSDRASEGISVSIHWKSITM